MRLSPAVLLQGPQSGLKDMKWMPYFSQVGMTSSTSPEPTWYSTWLIDGVTLAISMTSSMCFAQ